MKRKNLFLAIILTMVIAIVPSPAKSQVGFSLGLATGAVLFGDGNHDQSGAAATVLYTMTDVSKRIKNPLEVKLACKRRDFSSSFKTDGVSYSVLFSSIVSNSSKYEILQIVRVFSGENAENATIWFAFIEKRNVLPIKEVK